MIRFFATSLFLYFLVALNTGSSLAGAVNDDLNSTLWMQTSAEYQVLARQTYATAKEKLLQALKDPAWTGALERGANYSTLPPAVILDIDETVLDNSRYEGELIITNTSFSDDTWDRWIALAGASAVPGALDFVRFAKSKGVEIIYVTSRACRKREGPGRCPQEQDTIRNLTRLGFPAITDTDQILLRDEREGWTSEKQSRRQYVANRYRILMLIGDDLGDFLPNVRKNITPEDRRAVADQFASWWGERWFILPNPSYGSWERVLGGDKIKWVRGMEPPARTLK